MNKNQKNNDKDCYDILIKLVGRDKASQVYIRNQLDVTFGQDKATELLKV